MQSDSKNKISNEKRASLLRCYAGRGTFKAVTVGDLWTVIQPKMITTGELDKIKMEVPAFKPVWLMDTVCIFALQKRIPIIYDLKFTHHRDVL